MNLYTSAYMSGLNQHLPFLHLPSLDLNHMDVALLLSICSIGALYCFEKELARKLHEAAAVFLAEVNPSAAHFLDFLPNLLFPSLQIPLSFRVLG